ncbi:hypothetical protein F8S13_22315 [Chloroflexia bacterium SDU3-3]|nr:hypothetical protein F8S13_22315 [Chloroflexia bacterium SDU3-3]
MSPISPATLRALGDASALRALLAALGFRPVAHTILTAETLGWGERVAVDLRGRAFALLADADDGSFQVLLLLPQAGAAELDYRL